MRVGSDISKNFTQVAHKYPMLSLANTYSESEVTDFYERVRKALNEDFEDVYKRQAIIWGRHTLMISLNSVIFIR